MQKQMKHLGRKSFDRIKFSDEELFCTEKCHNAENVFIRPSTFEDIPETLRKVWAERYS